MSTELGMSGKLELAVSHEQSPLMLYGQQAWMIAFMNKFKASPRNESR